MESTVNDGKLSLCALQDTNTIYHHLRFQNNFCSNLIDSYYEMLRNIFVIKLQYDAHDRQV